MDIIFNSYNSNSHYIGIYMNNTFLQFTKKSYYVSGVRTHTLMERDISQKILTSKVKRGLGSSLNNS